MKADKQHNALEVIKKGQLKRCVFTVEFKAELVRHKKAVRDYAALFTRGAVVLHSIFGREWQQRRNLNGLGVSDAAIA